MILEITVETIEVRIMDWRCSECGSTLIKEDDLYVYCGECGAVVMSKPAV